MRISFISPSWGSKNSRIFMPTLNRLLYKVVFPPLLSFNMLAATTPKKYSIKLVNEEYQKINFKEECDLVGITSTTSTANRAYEIADEFRKRGVKVVLGGWHTSALPHEAKQHADSVVVGEAENSWPQLLHDLENEKLKPFYEQKQPVDLKTAPVPDRIRQSEGTIIAGVQATRGCAMGCHYCSITNSVHGRVFRYRPVEAIISEIQSIPQKILYFCDPSLTLNPDYTKQLFKGMKELDKKFYCNGNIDILNHDDELLKLARDAGCVEWAIGFESVSQKSLDFLGKITNKVGDFASAIDKIHDHGMGVLGNFIFGLDEDHPDIFAKTLDAVRDWELDLVGFNIFTPLPGTPLFDRMNAEGRILTRDWSLYDLHHVVFQPKHMTTQELLDGTMVANKEFFSKHNTVKRAFRCFKFGTHSFLMMCLENFFRGIGI